jgi:hypothetical protein
VVVSKSKLSPKKFNKPPDPSVDGDTTGGWVWLTREMLESPAWRATPLYARQVVDRIVIEHLKHCGYDNGRLPVTYEDFEKYGIRRKSIKDGITIAQALGWIDITVRGRPSFESYRYCSRYALTWLPQPKNSIVTTNRWKRIQTDEQAEAAIRRAMTGREQERDQRAAKGLRGQTRKPKIVVENKKPGAKTPLQVRGENAPTGKPKAA